MMLVTSYAEVWIEITRMTELPSLEVVTSYAEVWIEISSSAFLLWCIMSPPTRRCGLKLQERTEKGIGNRHLLRGGVD